MIISKRFTFESSHILPKHPGKCSRLHGHSWVLVVYVKGDVNKDTGFVMDYADISTLVKPLVDNLDHRHLGSWYHPMFDNSFIKQDHFVQGLPFDFYPSSENLLVWIGDQLVAPRSELWLTPQGQKAKTRPQLDWWRLELDETCTSKAILMREEYEIIVRNRSQNVSTQESGKLHKQDEEESVLEKGL